MAGRIDYTRLYGIQDIVLKLVSSLHTSFYLTGGTCLHRFYCNKRYSDDLDFFCNDNDLFRDYAREITGQLKKTCTCYRTVIDTRDFIRCEIENMLQIDFVNDRVYHHGGIVISDAGYRIDNHENILANKITAIISRDEPKDVFDLYSIAAHYPVRWNEIIDAALKKCFFEKDYLIDRLASFPVKLLRNLAVCDSAYIDEMAAEIGGVIEDIQAGV